MAALKTLRRFCVRSYNQSPCTFFIHFVILLNIFGKSENFENPSKTRSLIINFINVLEKFELSKNREVVIKLLIFLFLFLLFILFLDEKRGALKKIKSDASRYASLKNKTQLAKDQVRKDRVKRIMGQLANQEGEAKSYKKKKYNLFPDI